jgi:uncharacterized protein YdhG (YjbR/CyaY superfamily)
METDSSADINIYIAGFPEGTQKLLFLVRETIKKAAPNAAEKMSYGIPTFTLKGNLVHFAGYKNHIGFYPTPSAIIRFKKELSVYKSSKGSVQFPIDMPIPYELISKIVKYRVSEINEKTGMK